MMELNINDGVYSFSGRSINPTKEKNLLLEPYGKVLHNFGIILSLLPTEEQAEKLCRNIGCARFVRNNYLDARIAAYKKDKTILTVNDYMKNNLKQLKDNNKWLKEADKFALATAVEHVDAAYKNFFNNLKNGRKAGFPKFVSAYKPNGNRYTTKFTNNNIRVYEECGKHYINIPKVKKIRFVMPKGFDISCIASDNTRILSASIQKHNDDYTISLQMESVIDKIIPVSSVHIRDICGADMGIKDFCIYGNSEDYEKVENPKWFTVHEKRIRRLNKSLSRKVKGSANYKKAKAKLAKEHRKIKNQRKDFQHKLSRKIADTYKVFICEDLNIKGMVKNKRLSKQISSCGWGQFLGFVKYKIEKISGYFIKAERYFASSQICNNCGYKNPDVKDLSVRKWVCPECGTVHDRDVNAKNNLISEGIKILNNCNVEILYA